MALQVFTAGQTLTAAQMTTLQASTYNYPLSTISSSTYTILSSDAGKLLLFTNNATPVGVTFPASLGMAVGDTVEIVHAGTGTLSLIADAGVTLNSEGSLLILTTRYARISVTKTASNVFLVSWMTAITEAEITTGSVTSDKILDGTILNVDINASAAIALSKLATGALPTAITVASANLVDGTIVNADINASAAIELGKLADATIDIKSVNYPLVLTDKNKFIKMNSSSNRTITVPLETTVNFPTGSQIHLIRYGSGTLEIVGESGAVIIYATPGKFLRDQYSSATLLKCATTNTWMLMGDLSAT
jgi:hypothetical protein